MILHDIISYVDHQEKRRSAQRTGCVRRKQNVCLFRHAALATNDMYGLIVILCVYIYIYIYIIVHIYIYI